MRDSGEVGDAGHWALGHATVALEYARRSFATVESEGWIDYRRASAYEVVARAHAAAGNQQQRDEWVARAAQACAALAPADREGIGEQISTIPPAS